MSGQRDEHEFDATLERYLAWRAGRLAGAPDAGTVAARLERTIAGGHATRAGRLVPARGLLLVALIGLILAILGASVVGALREPDRSLGAPLSIVDGFGLAIDAGGGVTLGRLTPEGVSLVRFDGTGRLDRAYGSAGSVSLGGTWIDSAISVAVEPDGRIVLLRPDGAGDFEVARYRRDGIADATFGAGGVAPVAFPGFGTYPFIQDVASQIVVAPDGDILVIGTTDEVRRPSDGQAALIPLDREYVMFALARLKNDGSPDVDFGAAGGSTENVGAGRDSAYAAAIDEQGRVVIVGQTGYMTPGPQDNNIAVLRVLADGKRDPSFGEQGVVSTHVKGTLNSSAGGVAIDADGRVVVIGHGSSPLAVLRYLDDGSLDPSFGEGGVVTTEEVGTLKAVAVHTDGRIVLAGSTGKLTRLMPDGEIDPTFGSDGWVSPPSAAS